MSRNSQSHFAVNPTNIDIQRSRFSRPHTLKTTFNVGDLIPIYVDTDVLPGDTYQMDTSKVIRMQTLLTPMMDNVYLDYYWFFVPHRLVWEHWKQFMGENTESAWIPETEYTIPQITPPSGGWQTGTIADYFGVPTGIDGFSMSALPFRAYALVCNEWFRSTVVTDPLVVPMNDVTQEGSNGSSYITDVANGGAPFKAAKYFDYFTGALPSPQRGPDVEIPVAEFSGTFPVFTSSDYSGNADGVSLHGHSSSSVGGSGSGNVNGVLRFNTSGNSGDVSWSGITDVGAGNIRWNAAAASTGSFVPDNLWVDVGSGSSTAATINQLRMAFQIQRYYERLARGGDRYIEMIKSFFNVTSPDARLQRPEYLGGNRVPINVSQVIQTSETAEASPLGNTAGYSLTTDSHSDFTHSFTEHGTLLGLAVARYDHTYQQGLERQFSRKTRFDYYFPVFAHLGEQAILNKEIYLQSDEVIGDTEKPENEEVFGYQERWAEYRYKPSQVTGEMRSSATLSLDSWHLADDYSALPTLSDEWIREDKNTVDRVLAVTSSVSNQLFMDIFFNEKVTRPMPLYSVPGLIDHY